MFKVNFRHPEKCGVIVERLRGLTCVFFVVICQSISTTYMDIPPDELERRIRMVTRSGRAIRPPDRYEPEADQIFEDDFSDVPSESEEEEWG